MRIKLSVPVWAIALCVACSLFTFVMLVILTIYVEDTYAIFTATGFCELAVAYILELIAAKCAKAPVVAGGFDSIWVCCDGIALYCDQWHRNRSGRGIILGVFHIGMWGSDVFCSALPEECSKGKAACAAQNG